MSRRHAARLAVLLAAATAILGSTTPGLALAGGPGSDSTATALAPDDALALATAPADESSGSSTSAVDGITALTASSLPGAQTSIAPGLSPDAAVGLAPLDSLGAISASKPSCWANVAWHEWGTWPYQQRLMDTTYWCAVYGEWITYRTSSTTSSGTLCATGWTASQLIAGGIGPGFPYFTIRASAGFSCPTVIPWVTIHTTHHEDVKRNDKGATTFVGTG